MPDTLADLGTQIKSLKETADKQLKTKDAEIKALAEQNTHLKSFLEKPDYKGLDPAKLFAQPRDAKTEGAWGFGDLGQFAKEVAKSTTERRHSERIEKMFRSDMIVKAAAGMGELIGSDGGFLVPPTFSTTLFERIYSNDLLSRTDQYTVAGNQMVFPRNAETSRATGSRYGGVQSYWRQEGAAPTTSKPTFGRFTLTLHKLISLAAVTTELIEDSSMALEQYLNRVFTDEIQFLIGDAIMNGTGAGQPLGLLNSPCLVSQAKETGQAATTINTQNIVKMWSRLWAGCRDKAVWLVNQDTEPQLYTMTLGIGTAGIATYMPPGGLSGKPYATILGAPVIATEFNATLGTVGDIILVDMSHYVTINKGGPNAQTSMHLYFDTDEAAFRVSFRISGASWWSAPLTPFKGTSNTQSHIVALATRS